MTLRLSLLFLVVSGNLAEANADEATANSGEKLKRPYPAGLLVSELFDENILTENVLAVRQQEFELAENDRYEYLANWVLPSATHATIRMSGAFTPNDPAPPLLTGYRDVTGPGGSLVSPVFDLLDLAARLGRTEELRERIAMLPEPTTQHQQRAHAAIRILLSLELKDATTVDREVEKLRGLVTSMVPRSMADQWPETLVAYFSVNKFPRSSACDIVGDLVSHRMQRGIPHETTEWHSQIFALSGKLKSLQLKGTALESESADKLRNWMSVNRSRWVRDAAGVAESSWQFRNGECVHITGRDEDYLIYRSPLTGNFDLDLDVHPFGSTQILAAGALFGPRANHAELGTGNIRVGGDVAAPFDPPFNKFDDWIHCRASFRDGIRSIFINGRLVATDKLAEHHDPWLGVRAWPRSEGRFRNVRISGEPIVPHSVRLSETADLSGWYSYLDDSVGHEHAYWNYVKKDNQPGEIVGRTLTWHYGAISERLLRYFRPMAENGSMEYEFYYEPDKAVTHPAFDRLAFIIAPDGIRIHWVTDDFAERTGLRPDNETVESDNRRGPEDLPLKIGDWNQMKVAVNDSIVSLELNGQVVYERALESTNRRTFGFFNYADRGDARVRNVVMRGGWPKIVPSISEQELTSSNLMLLDVKRSAAEVSVFHDFVVDGVPEKYFYVPPISDECTTDQTEEGLVQEIRSPGGWKQASVKSWLEMHGDFDVAVGFDEMVTDGHDHYGAALVVNCGSGHRIQVGCRHDKKHDDKGIVVGWLIPTGTGEFRPNYNAIHTEATTGHLRIARRGNTWFALFAENGSSSYQIVGSQTLEATANYPATFDTLVIATDGGTSHVVWKDVQISADELMIFPDPLATPVAGLFTMNSDGSDLRQIPLDDPDITSPGSADWSPDGKQIAFDQYSTTSIYLVNVDGTGLKRIGSGAMPTFSPDGKRLAFSGGGMCVMNIDGSNIDVLSQDGWGAQWSPNGKWIAYESRQRVSNSLTSNITIIDLETKQKRTILEGNQASRYSQIFWNMEWSPDSSQICFKGKVKGGGSEMAITNVGGSTNGFQVVTDDEVVEDFSWHPDGTRILMSKHSPEYAGHRLFVCDTKAWEITMLESQPMDQKSVSGVWSPDGSRIVFSSTPIPKAVPWQSR